MKKIVLAVGALAAVAATPSAAAVNLTIEGGGTPIVYQGDNGNRYAVFGIDARRQDSDNIVNLPNFTVDTNFIRSLIISGGASRLQNVFSCTGSGVTFGCSPFTSISVPDEARLFNNLLLEFTGTSNLVFSQPSGGTTTLSLNVTQQGAPPIGGAVPEPSTWAMMLLGFFGIGFAMRKGRVEKVSVAYA